MSGSRILLAFDFDRADQALALAEKLNPQTCRIKIGKTLFTREGPQLVQKLQQMGFDIFLDLKFHDIPNTVAEAVRAAADLGVWMVNVHASGGRRMMEAAANVLARGSERSPHLIAVTVLTSMNEQDLQEIGIVASAEEQVMRLTRLACESGLDGVVCSAWEAAEVKKKTHAGFLTVTPGIRPQGAAVNDQSRIMTPEAAIAAGSDYLVIGRPVTQAANPAAALAEIHAGLQISGGSAA